MLAHLTVMSWQRNALINASIPFRPPPPPFGVTSRWAVAFRDDTDADAWYSVRPLLVKLTDVVMDTETNVKLKQAALDLLGALCKDNEDIAAEAMHLLDVDESEGESVPLGNWDPSDTLGLIAQDLEGSGRYKTPDYAQSIASSPAPRNTVAPVFDELVGSRSNGIAVSAACWCVHENEAPAPRRGVLMHTIAVRPICSSVSLPIRQRPVGNTRTGWRYSSCSCICWIRPSRIRSGSVSSSVSSPLSARLKHLETR